jgi:hypothetical protein
MILKILGLVMMAVGSVYFVRDMYLYWMSGKPLSVTACMVVMALVWLVVSIYRGRK